MDVTSCIFCQILAGEEPATVISVTPAATVIEPLRPVVSGHLLFIANRHLEDFTFDPVETSWVMADVASYARRHPGSYNVITSAGRPATQSVFHLHVHLVPRRYGDGLALPWDLPMTAENHPRIDT
jgi:histidine triad (HIT) family protein